MEITIIGKKDILSKRDPLSTGYILIRLEDYSALKALIVNMSANKDARVLVLGCGNAAFSEQMYDDGYKNIVNIDISKSVIDYMRVRNEKRSGMEWLEMDVRKLEFDDNYFDLLIDKSTIDALLCGKYSYINVAHMMNESQRVLKVGGSYMAISYGCPENRLIHFQREHLSFDISIFTIKKNNPSFPELNKEKLHYVYCLVKNKDADELSREVFEKVMEDLEKQEMSGDDNKDASDEEDLKSLSFSVSSG